MVGVISEFSGDKSLLIDLPKSLLCGINIAADGTLDVGPLIKVLDRNCKYQLQFTFKQLKSASDHLIGASSVDSLPFEERMDLFDVIFNPDRAIKDPIRKKG